MSGVPAGIWAAGAGVQAADWQVQALANDIANVDTPGFQALVAVPGDAAPEAVYPAGLAVGPPVPPQVLGGGGVAPEALLLNLSEGPLEQTGRAMDAAILGPGLFALRDAKGATVYTRAGRFFVDAAGDVVDGAGRLLLDTRGQPIRLPAGAHDPQIRADGTVTASSASGSAVSAGRIGLAFPADPQGLRGSGAGVWVATPAAGAVAVAPPDGTVARLVPATLEQSNTDLAVALPELIAAERAYQASLQALQGGLQLWDRSNQLHA